MRNRNHEPWVPPHRFPRLICWFHEVLRGKIGNWEWGVLVEVRTKEVFIYLYTFSTLYNCWSEVNHEQVFLFIIILVFGWLWHWHSHWHLLTFWWVKGIYRGTYRFSSSMFFLVAKLIYHLNVIVVYHINQIYILCYEIFIEFIE